MEFGDEARIRSSMKFVRTAVTKPSSKEYNTSELPEQNLQRLGLFLLGWLMNYGTVAEAKETVLDTHNGRKLTVDDIHLGVNLNEYPHGTQFVHSLIRENPSLYDPRQRPIKEWRLNQNINILGLIYLAGMSPSEISKAYGMSSEGISQSRNRILQRLYDASSPEIQKKISLQELLTERPQTMISLKTRLRKIAVVAAHFGISKEEIFSQLNLHNFDNSYFLARTIRGDPKLTLLFSADSNREKDMETRDIIGDPKSPLVVIQEILDNLDKGKMRYLRKKKLLFPLGDMMNHKRIREHIDILKEFGIPVGDDTRILTGGRILRYFVTSSHYREKLQSFLDSHPELKKIKKK